MIHNNFTFYQFSNSTIPNNSDNEVLLVELYTGKKCARECNERIGLCSPSLWLISSTVLLKSRCVVVMVNDDVMQLLIIIREMLLLTFLALYVHGTHNNCCIR